MKGELLFLGTGGATGVPNIGCDCKVCQSTNPKNKRLRPSALVTINGKKLVIDTGPDFRFQALANGITTLDGVLITHTHFDHIAGLDELRIFYLRTKKMVPILLSETSYKEIKQRLSYLFRERNKELSFPAQLDFHILKEKGGVTSFQGVTIGYTTYEQGGTEVTGFRIGNLAYLSDLKKYPETIYEGLKGVEILVMSALREEPLSPMHLTIDEAIEFSRKVKPQKTIFMHMGHEVEHEKVNGSLPEGFELSYDGMRIEFDG